MRRYQSSYPTSLTRAAGYRRISDHGRRVAAQDVHPIGIKATIGLVYNMFFVFIFCTGPGSASPPARAPTVAALSPP
jgi:hypothetical protein